jgi:uncharacterized membrane protein
MQDGAAGYTIIKDEGAGFGMGRLVYNPFSILLFVLLIMLLLFIIPFLFLGIAGGAITKLGFSWGQALFILFITLLGSFVNIPVKKIESGPVPLRREYTRYGFFYRISEVSPTTVIAVNLGGAVIPVVISLYLLSRILSLVGVSLIFFSAMLGIAVVAGVTHHFAKPVPGLGIATPFLVPPMCALFCGILLSWGTPMMAPVIAYVSGTLGTLIGADILNLHRIAELGTPVASIGGAGTFDGIFLSGIIAAFLA